MTMEDGSYYVLIFNTTIEGRCICIRRPVPRGWQFIFSGVTQRVRSFYSTIPAISGWT